MQQQSKITIHMVSSLDGIIAKKDGNIDWMQSQDHHESGITLSEEDIAIFLSKIDCYVMGSKTFEHAVEFGWPYGDVPVKVLTSRKLITDKENVEFCAGDLPRFVQEKLTTVYQNIWMVGGAQLTKQFIQLGLADEIVLTIMPVILGSGIPFFDEVSVEKQLHLRDVVAYRDGMVELTYQIKK